MGAEVKMLKLTVLVVTLMMAIDSIAASKDTMQTISVNFLKGLHVCKKEKDLPDSIMEDFVNFWRDDYQLVDRQTGCALHCMSTKLDLIDPEGKLHHGNAKEYAKTHGADQSMADKLVEIFQTCADTTPKIEDGCMMVLNVAKCFKAEIHKLDWAPDMDLIAAELLVLS